MLRKISWLVALLSVSSLAACSSDDSEDGGGADLGSGVDSDKQGEDLTDDEVESICQAGQDYVEEKVSSDSFNKSVCRFAAASIALASGDEATMKSLCDLGYDKCVDCIGNPDKEGCEDFDTDTEQSDCSIEEAPADCTSTVGEIEACLKATLDLSVSLFEDVPGCDELTEDTELPVVDDELDMPAACETVEENCPEVLE